MKRARALAVAGLALAAVVAPATAPGPAAARAAAGPDYASVVVQARKYPLRHEIGVHVGVLPLDAFTKGVTLGGGYTLHLTTALAWEVARYEHSFHFDASLKDDLAAFDLRPTPFEVVDRYLSTNLVFKPLYLKGALLDASVVHGELFLVAGGVYGWFTRSKRPGVDYGVGLRLFLSRLFSVRLDARHLMFMQGGDGGVDVHHELWIGLGASLSL